MRLSVTNDKLHLSSPQDFDTICEHDLDNYVPDMKLLSNNMINITLGLWSALCFDFMIGLQNVMKVNKCNEAFEVKFR
jgi:hypothetical protein